MEVERFVRALYTLGSASDKNARPLTFEYGVFWRKLADFGFCATGLRSQRSTGPVS